MLFFKYLIWIQIYDSTQFELLFSTSIAPSMVSGRGML